MLPAASPSALPASSPPKPPLDLSGEQLRMFSHALWLQLCWVKQTAATTCLSSDTSCSAAWLVRPCVTASWPFWTTKVWFMKFQHLTLTHSCNPQLFFLQNGPWLHFLLSWKECLVFPAFIWSSWALNRELFSLPQKQEKLVKSYWWSSNSLKRKWHKSKNFTFMRRFGLFVRLRFHCVKTHFSLESL